MLCHKTTTNQDYDGKGSNCGTSDKGIGAKVKSVWSGDGIQKKNVDTEDMGI